MLICKLVFEGKNIFVLLMSINYLKCCSSIRREKGEKMALSHISLRRIAKLWVGDKRERLFQLRDNAPTFRSALLAASHRSAWGFQALGVVQPKPPLAACFHLQSCLWHDCLETAPPLLLAPAAHSPKPPVPMGGLDQLGSHLKGTTPVHTPLQKWLIFICPCSLWCLIT